MPVKRRRRQSGLSIRSWIITIFCCLACLVAGYFWGARTSLSTTSKGEGLQPPNVIGTQSSGVRSDQEEIEPGRKDRSRSQTAEASGALIALVIDDLGRSLTDLDRLSELEIPLSYSVLPFETKTAAVVAELTRRRAEILCHLPMEPGTGADPGLGALTLEMSRPELRRAVQAALRAVPGARGVNNHMGSRMTEDAKVIETILKVLLRERLFYLDSRTSAKSQGYRVARKLGVPVAERQVFLDDDLNPASIRQQFELLREMAKKNGKAIAIGHPHKETLAVLRTEVQAALQDGYRFVRVSRLLDSDIG